MQCNVTWRSLVKDYLKVCHWMGTSQSKVSAVFVVDR